MTFALSMKLRIADIRPACPVTNGLHPESDSNTRVVSYLVAVLRAGARGGDGRRLSRELRAADTLLPVNRRQVNIV